MKTALSLLLLVAAASSLPLQLNQLLPDLPQTSNALDGNDNAVEVNEASQQSSSDAGFSRQPIPAAIASIEPQQPAFVAGNRAAAFGALLADQDTAVAEQQSAIKEENNPEPFRESFAKQFSDSQQPAYGAAFYSQSGGEGVPSFGVSPGGQLGVHEQQADFGESASSQFDGSQQFGFGAASEDQFRENQEPAFGSSSNSQFDGPQQSGFGAAAGESQFGDNQQPAFGESSPAQFGDSQQFDFAGESGNQFDGSQSQASDASFITQTDGSQQNGFEAPGNSQFGGDQQSGFNASPDTQFGVNQPSDIGSNFAGGQPSSAAGSSGPFNVAIGDEYYIRTALPSAGFIPTKYTALDLTQVDFENALRSSGHQEFISVPGDDASDEAEVYRLVGVAPASAVQGGSAQIYSANIGASVPIYRELEDLYEERMMTQMRGGVNPQATVYSAMAGSQQPVMVKAEGTLSGGNFAVLLDD